MKNIFLYFDNRSKSSNAVDIERHIHSLGDVLAYEDCFWIIRTDLPVSEIRDSVDQFLSDFDPLLVGELGTTLATGCWHSDSLSRLRDFFTTD